MNFLSASGILARQVGASLVIVPLSEMVYLCPHRCPGLTGGWVWLLSPVQKWFIFCPHLVSWAQQVGGFGYIVPRPEMVDSPHLVSAGWTDRCVGLVSVPCQKWFICVRI